MQSLHNHGLDSGDGKQKVLAMKNCMLLSSVGLYSGGVYLTSTAFESTRDYAPIN